MKLNFITTIFRYFLILIGFIMLLTFIWLRFLRERLPKDIPFILNILGFIILLYICCIYFYIIFSLLTNYKTKNALLSMIYIIVYKPLVVLDESLKNNYFIKPYYMRVLFYYSHYLIKDISEKAYYNIYIFCIIFPRVILVFALIIDIFIFNCLYFIYKVVLIYLVIFICKYIIYSLKYAKEHFIIELENMVDCIFSNYKDPDDNDELSTICLSNLSVRSFIDKQISAIVYENHTYTYQPQISIEYDLEYRKNNKLPLTLSYRLSNKEIDMKMQDFYVKMKILISIAVFIEEFELRHEFDTIKRMKIILYSLFVMCWLYIFVVSLHTLPADSFAWLDALVDKEEPFSILKLII